MITLRKSGNGRLIADHLSPSQLAQILNTNIVNKHEVFQILSVKGFEKSIVDIFQNCVVEVEGTTKTPYLREHEDGTEWYCLRLHLNNGVHFPLLHVQIRANKFEVLFSH